MKRTLPLLAALILLISCKTADVKPTLKDNEVASVFGKVITLEEFEKEVKHLTLVMIPKDYVLTAEEEKTFRIQILNSMIQKEMFTIKMNALDIQSDAKYVEEQLEQLYSQFESEETMLKEIEAKGYTVEKLQGEFEYQSRLNSLSMHIEKSDIEVSEEDIMKYYEDNIDSMFSREGSITARHILIPSQDENTFDEVVNIREEILDGLEFSEAARKYSKGPSASNGGLLPPFTKGQMVKEFEEAALNTPVNEVSQPVLTQFGYHLIYVEERAEKIIAPYEETKEYIAVQLKQDIFFNNLKDEAKIIKADWATE